MMPQSLTFLFMAAIAVACGLKLELPMALAAWAALTALLCAAGALLIRLQPMGVVTAGGRFGGRFLRWGFRAGHGRLPAIACISWLVWMLLGAMITGVTQSRSQPRLVLMTLAWAVDAAALMWVLGVLSVNWRSSGPMKRSLMTMALALAGMIAGSAALWWGVATDGSRAAALLLAGGPPLVLGGGYGLMLAAMMTMGRKARWN